MSIVFPEGPLLIIFCRHLGSKSCRKEILKLWNKLTLEERKDHRLLLVYGDGNPSSIAEWERTLGEQFSFFKDENQETFNRYNLYSGIVVLADRGLLIKKLPLPLLEMAPSVPYRFLSNQGLRSVSKI